MNDTKPDNAYLTRYEDGTDSAKGPKLSGIGVMLTANRLGDKNEDEGQMFERYVLTWEGAVTREDAVKRVREFADAIESQACKPWGAVQ